MNRERFDSVCFTKDDQPSVRKCVPHSDGEFATIVKCEQECEQNTLSSTEKRCIRQESFQWLKAGSADRTRKDRFEKQLESILRARRQSFLKENGNELILTDKVRAEYEKECEIAAKFERRKKKIES